MKILSKLLELSLWIDSVAFQMGYSINKGYTPF